MGRVTDDRRSLLGRREILAAYVVVLDRLGELTDVCAAVTGDADELRIALQESFDLSPSAADAILHIQVRRFTPTERLKIEQELAEVDLSLQQIGRA